MLRLQDTQCQFIHTRTNLNIYLYKKMVLNAAIKISEIQIKIIKKFGTKSIKYAFDSPPKTRILNLKNVVNDFITPNKMLKYTL